jgi:hypothetical protein
METPMKFECECGKRIVDQTDSLSFKGYLISDQDFSDYQAAIDEAIEKSGPSEKEKESAIMAVRSLNVFKIMYQCSGCGSIYINDSNENLHQYTPKNDLTSKKILQSKSNA